MVLAPNQRAVTIRELLAEGGESYSFEFMPPKTEDAERQLWRAIRQLEAPAPTFGSVSYSAGGPPRYPTARVTAPLRARPTPTPPRPRPPPPPPPPRPPPPTLASRPHR